MEKESKAWNLPQNGTSWVYRNEKNVYVHETHIKSVTPNRKKTQIVQITDPHLTHINEKDFSDEEIINTHKCRKWIADSVTVPAIIKSMEYAKDYDRTVITGDTLDYLSYGCMEQMQRYVWDVDPNCIVALGGHDVSKQVETDLPEKMPLSERQKIVQKFWKHDIFYYSEIVNDNVMIIAMDNGCKRYWEIQVPKLEADLKKAKENGYTVLIFQHEAVSTGKEADREVPSYFHPHIKMNFYENYVGYPPISDEATMQVYRLITQNADVVKGLFCGHEHFAFYMEVEASYTDGNGNRIKATIPQYLSECNIHDNFSGNVRKIIIA